MSAEETVRIDISIQIDQQDVVDTGLTVAQWNALSDAERWRIAREQWDIMASRDDGGMSVVTEGAEDI